MESWGRPDQESPLRGLVDDHARYRQGMEIMEICRAGACGVNAFLRAAHESLPTPHGD
jgi:hypothetical protein